MTPQQISDLVLRRQAQMQAASPDEVLFPDFALYGLTVFPQPAPGLDLALTQRAWTEPWPDFKPKQIALSVRTDASPVLEWLPAGEIGDPSVGDWLMVRLAPAEELTLEFSSAPKFLDHFAVAALALPQTAAYAVAAGRHPQVSPLRTVTLTHAVRQPLAAPAGTLTARRAENQTFATLDPSTVMLGIDTNSTARVVITATWQNPDRPEVINDAPVASFMIGRGDQGFADDIRHDFADTRHRQVSYAVVAQPLPPVLRRERTRRELRPVEHDRAGQHSELGARAGARGPIGAPAFAWKETRSDGPPFALARWRLPGLIRVELQGAWFATGEGELITPSRRARRRSTTAPASSNPTVGPFAGNILVFREN